MGAGVIALIDKVKDLIPLDEPPGYEIKRFLV